MPSEWTNHRKDTHREGVGHSLDTQFCELPPAAIGPFKCAQSHSSTRTTTRDSAQEVKIAQPTTSHAKAQGERWGQRQKQEQAWMWPKRAGAADQQGSRDQGWEEIVLGLQPAQRVQQGSSGRIMWPRSPSLCDFWTNPLGPLHNPPNNNWLAARSLYSKTPTMLMDQNHMEYRILVVWESWTIYENPGYFGPRWFWVQVPLLGGSSHPMDGWTNITGRGPPGICNTINIIVN